MTGLVVPVIDLSTFMAVAGAVLVASAAFWAVRKGLSLLG